MKYFKKQIFKEASDDWYPCYDTGNNKLVKVTFSKDIATQDDLDDISDDRYYVNVWGNDDFGMGISDLICYSTGQQVFNAIIEQKYVTQDFLTSIGFEPL